MNLFLYNFAMFLLLPFIAIRVLFKSLKDKDYRTNFSNRFGIYKNESKINNAVWFHAVSLGEVIASKKIVKAISKEHKVVLSVSTPTGFREAKKIFGSDIEIIYSPWDFSAIVSSFYKTYQPIALILFETEIWPNMINEAFNTKVPIVLCNGRMSNSSYRSYKRFKLFSKQTLNKISFFFVQSNAHLERFRSLGVPKNKIQNVGSVKFDIDILNLKDDKKYSNNHIILAASTHTKEDEIIVQAFKELKNEFDDIKLIIAPRHPERAQTIKTSIAKMNLNSQIYTSVPEELNNIEIGIINATGLLKDLYSISTIAFVGGSLFKEYGGHNIIESAAQRCPFVVGPYTKNFEDILEKFLKNQGCIQVSNKKDLVNAFKSLLSDRQLRDDMSSRAVEVCMKSQGSFDEQCNAILKIIRGDKIEISNSDN
jgi:3-deoxy-D-manno-octulosonic-acid transferase